MSEPALITADGTSPQPSLDGSEGSEAYQPDVSALLVATRVTTTPELLDLVFSFLERFDLTKTALVSHFWLEISRQHIWRDVDNAWELFALLAPLRPIRGDRGFEFERVPSHEDWLRFRPFALRVRKLSIEGIIGDDDYSKVVTPILSKLATTRLWHPVLPSLRTLEFYQDHNLAQLSLFLHPSLEELITFVPPTDLEGYPAGTICDDIAWKAPYIRHLELVPDRCATLEPAEKAIATLLLRLENCLLSLYLPIYGLTPVVFEAASRLQHVEEIAFSTTPGPTTVGLYSDVLVFTPYVESGSFPALRKLSLSAPLGDLVELLSNPNFPASRLSEFLVRAARPEVPEAVETFHAAVARECKSLNVYCLILTAPYDDGDENERWLEPPAPDTALGWTSIAPLTNGALRGLLSVTIAHEHALKLNIQQLADLARSLPSLEYLVCNPSPHALSDTPPAIKLIELSILVDCLPCVQNLELCVDASDPSVQYPRRSEKYFPRLRNLWMGASPVHSERRMGIALFLASLLATGAQIGTERWDIWDYVAPESRYVGEWDRIAEDVALLMEARTGAERAALCMLPS